MRSNRFAALLLPALVLQAPALAQERVPHQDPAQVEQKSASQQAWENADKAATKGPADIAIVDQATLHLLAGMEFVPKTESNALLKAWGNADAPDMVGLVTSTSEDESWVITIDQASDGHVSDEEAKNWNADALLKSIKDGTDEDNINRVSNGFAPLEVLGWLQPPSYDSAAHKLVWAIKAQEKNAAADQAKTVNYNTYALGRDGYFKLDLLSDDQTFDQDKPKAQQVLAAFQYKPGKTYADYDSSTDRLAEYGIAALIGGVAAKKLGLLALASVFILKFIKLIGVGVVVALAALKRLFTGPKSPS